MAPKSKKGKGKKAKLNNANQAAAGKYQIFEAKFHSVKVLEYNVEELSKLTTDFHKIGLIGMSRFGSVYRGILHEKPVAVKRSNGKSEPKTKQYQGENIVRLLGLAEFDNNYYLVYEKLEGDIVGKLKGRFGLDWQVILKILKGLANFGANP